MALVLPIHRVEFSNEGEKRTVSEIPDRRCSLPSIEKDDEKSMEFVDAAHNREIKASGNDDKTVHIADIALEKNDEEDKVDSQQQYWLMGNVDTKHADDGDRSNENCSSKNICEIAACPTDLERERDFNNISFVEEVEPAEDMNTSAVNTICPTDSERERDFNSISFVEEMEPAEDMNTSAVNTIFEKIKDESSEQSLMEMDEHDRMKTSITTIPAANSPYGGLVNLGNTCYMASAIQLLAGLDSFPADLKVRIPPPALIEDIDDGGKCPSLSATCSEKKLYSQSVRDALIDVFDRLDMGQRVRPDDLKRCVDNRTGLFLGYHQQDSHEFLTTLLDIIDEDYNIKARELSAQPAAENIAGDKKEKDDKICVRDEELNSSEGKDCNVKKESGTDLIFENKVYNVITSPLNGKLEGMDNNVVNDLQDESALKKQKLLLEEEIEVENCTSWRADSTVDGSKTSIQKSKSYSEFLFSDIESLLHESKSSADRPSLPSTPVLSVMDRGQYQPKYKLAGGRMCTIGTELTRYIKDDDKLEAVNLSLDTIKSHQHSPQDTNMQLEEVEGWEERNTSLSPVASNFTSHVRVCLTCESCKFRRSHIETYLHLSLEVGSDVSSIEDGLRKFFAPEKREIKCEKCFHTSAIQTSEITKLPRNLLFHLKRFVVDVSPDYSSISYLKDQSPISFEERIELEVNDNEGGFQDFLALDASFTKGAAYKIRSVVNHIGSSVRCGHYTADAKRRCVIPEREGERQWIRFNDSYVSEISIREAVQNASKTAYMIMYELEE